LLEATFLASSSQSKKSLAVTLRAEFLEDWWQSWCGWEDAKIDCLRIHDWMQARLRTRNGADGVKTGSFGGSEAKVKMGWEAELELGESVLKL